jgi:hypothetical protein
MINQWLTARRIWRYPIFLLVASVISYAGSIAGGDGLFDAMGMPLFSDFSAQQTAGRIALDGDIGRLYDLQHQHAVQQEILAYQRPEYLNIFISPPIAAFLYVPFAHLPYLPAAAIWTAVSVAALLVSLRTIWPLVPEFHTVGLGKVALVAFSAPPVIECLQTGQDSLIVLLIMCLGVRALAGRHEAKAGAVLGLGMFKPQLFILFPVLFIAQRRWRALGAYSAVGIGMVLISVALLGGQGGVLDYVELLRSDSYLTGIVELGGWNMQSIAPLLRGIVPRPWHMPMELTIVLGGAWTVWVMARRHALSPGRRSHRELRLYAATVLIAALVSPHFFLYDGSILVLPAMLLLSAPGVSPRMGVGFSALYGGLMLAPAIHTAAARMPATPGRIIDTQWSVLIMLGLVTWVWNDRWQTSPVAHGDNHAWPVTGTRVSQISKPETRVARSIRARSRSLFAGPSGGRGRLGCRSSCTCGPRRRGDAGPS